VGGTCLHLELKGKGGEVLFILSFVKKVGENALSILSGDWRGNAGSCSPFLTSKGGGSSLSDQCGLDG